MSTETIRWIPAGERLPDAEMSVMVATTSDTVPVWLGWYDGEQWLDSEAVPISVTHWAEIPGGPGA